MRITEKEPSAYRLAWCKYPWNESGKYVLQGRFRWTEPHDSGGSLNGEEWLDLPTLEIAADRR